MTKDIGQASSRREQQGDWLIRASTSRSRRRAEGEAADMVIAEKKRRYSPIHVPEGIKSGERDEGQTVTFWVSFLNVSISFCSLFVLI